MVDILCYHFVPNAKEDRKFEAVLVQAEVMEVGVDGVLRVRPVTQPSIVDRLNGVINRGRSYRLQVVDHPLPNIEGGADYKPEHDPVKREITNGKLWLKKREEECFPGGYFIVRV